MTLILSSSIKVSRVERNLTSICSGFMLVICTHAGSACINLDQIDPQIKDLLHKGLGLVSI